jgi:hypothetical protein
VPHQADDSLVIDYESSVAQFRCNPSIAIPELMFNDDSLNGGPQLHLLLVRLPLLK